MGLLEDYYRSIMDPQPRRLSTHYDVRKNVHDQTKTASKRPLTRSIVRKKPERPRLLSAIPQRKNNQEEESVVRFKVAWRASQEESRHNLPKISAKSKPTFNILSAKPFFPLQLLHKAQVNISKWSLLASDDTFIKIAAHNTRIRNCKHRLTFVMGEEETKSIVANGVDNLTDLGIVAISRAIERLECLEIAQAIKVSDAGMRALALNCSTLTCLNISGCIGIAGAGLAAVSDHCPKMQRLVISKCTHLDEWVLIRCFYSFQMLTYFDAAECVQITDNTIKTMAYQCRKLTHIDLSDCPQITDTGLVCIAKYCKSIESLIVATAKGKVNERVTDILCLTLGEHCSNLKVFNVSGCTFITDVGIGWLVQGCPNLEHLDLTFCFKITDESMRRIGASSSKLQTLRIGHAKSISDVGLRFLSDGCQHLRTLSLQQLYLISDGVKRNFGLEGLQAVAQSCKQLVELDLSGCFQVVERALKSLGAQCCVLTKIRLKGCCNVTPIGISYILHGCPKLESIDLTNVQQCSNIVLQDIARTCTNIKELIFVNCDRITDVGVRFLECISDQLVLLNFAGCRLVTDVGLIAFVSSFRVLTPALSHLILDGCSGVTDDFANRLAFACPSLLTLSMHNCGISSRALYALKTSWKYTTFRSTNTELGCFPTLRAKEQRHIDMTGQLILAAMKIQNIFRMRKARLRYAMELELWQRHRVVCRIQSHFRGRRARRRALLLKLIQSGDHRMATKIQRWYLAHRNMKKAQDQFDALKQKQITEVALLVQRRYRATRQARLVKVASLAKARQREKLRRAVIVVQRRWRGIAGRHKYSLLRAAKRARNLEEKQSATQLQALIRGRKARQEAALMRQQKVEQAAREHAAVIKLQAYFRQKLAARELVMRREHLALLNRSAVKMQCAWRCRQGRNFLGVLRMAKHRRDQENAASYIQNRWRARKSYLNRVWEATMRRKEYEKRVASANRLKIWWKHIIERREAKTQLYSLFVLKQRDEAMVFWAANIVQSHYRRHEARKVLARLKEESKTCWKQMIDTENALGKGLGAPYYYNQINYDVRWRMPGEILSALPQPKCDQCEKPLSAEAECSHCGEYFCNECLWRIHAHGKRQFHSTRKLYNYYRKRIDYGDGEFPSFWPSEVDQDALRPWDFILGVPKEGYDEFVKWVEEENLRLFLLRHQPVHVEEAPLDTAPLNQAVPIVQERAVNEDSKGNKIMFRPIGTPIQDEMNIPVVIPSDFDAHYQKKTKRKRRKLPSTRQKQILKLD